MGRVIYDQYIKDEAIRRYRDGEDSTKISSDMRISNGALIRKWAEKDRNEQGIPVEEYRKSKASTVEGIIQNLRNDNLKLKNDLNIVAKFTTLIIKGDITGWEELYPNCALLKGN
jgi:hypothetical protein